MSCISLLQKIGLLPVVRHSELEDAAAENVQRNALDHSDAVQRVTVSAQRINESNRRLRESIGRLASISTVHHTIE
jgi:hypothetical protein